MPQPPAVNVRPLARIEEYRALQNLQRRVWNLTPEDTVLHLPLLVGLQKNGGLVLGAFTPDEDKLVGFAVSYLGHEPETGRYYHFSQIVGVEPEWQSSGVGLSLKLSQRDELLARGLNLLKWTFDPLQSRNAYFNIARLGGICRRYEPDLYGPGWGGLYGNRPLDRLALEWELDSERVRERVALALEGKPVPVRAVESIPVLTPGVGISPTTDLIQNAPFLRLEIPFDLKNLPADDLLEWVGAVRTLFLHYLGSGYRVEEFYTIPDGNHKRSFYLLVKH
jgi:predicted GNAT superfamily acetyltransferase